MCARKPISIFANYLERGHGIRAQPLTHLLGEPQLILLIKDTVFDYLFVILARKVADVGMIEVPKTSKLLLRSFIL